MKYRNTLDWVTKWEATVVFFNKNAIFSKRFEVKRRRSSSELWEAKKKKAKLCEERTHEIYNYSNSDSNSSLLDQILLLWLNYVFSSEIYF